MAYVALYRRWRPQRFEDLVGQEPIVRTLLNQLESGRIAHAYLFAGPRGTGKTSTAKLFARAINCQNLKEGEPCGKCEACLAAGADENMDIIEIDAASNNGVDNIRDIRDKVVFAPAVGKYKVYIIDEVHMLSGGAFNALLKTLEEPPKHAVFILATTEIHKLPATILSRCQRFDFKLISSKVIAQRLEYVLKESGAEFETAAVELIAKSAGGGMRDALSLADVCLSYCGSRVTLDDAMGVLGISDRGFIFDFADALLVSDIAKVLEKCRELEGEGKDISVFIAELMEHMRDILLCMYAPESEELVSLPREMQARLKTQTEQANGERLLRAVEILSALEADIKQHNRPEIQLETAMIRICTPRTESDYSAYEDRLAELERKVSQLCVNGLTAPETISDRQEISQEELPPWETPSSVPNAPKDEPMKEKKASAAAAPAPRPAAAADRNSNGLWNMLLARVKTSDLPLYMMIRGFDGAAAENDGFTIYIPQAAASKEGLVRKYEGVLADHLEELSGRRLKVHAVVGAKPLKNGEEEQDAGSADRMQAALDLFS